MICHLSQHEAQQMLRYYTITTAKVQNSTFSIVYWSSSVEFWITGYYKPD